MKSEKNIAAHHSIPPQVSRKICGGHFKADCVSSSMPCGISNTSAVQIRLQLLPLQKKQHCSPTHARAASAGFFPSARFPFAVSNAGHISRLVPIKCDVGQ